MPKDDMAAGDEAFFNIELKDAQFKLLYMS